MELKEYQKKTLDQVKLYIESLLDFKSKYEKVKEIYPELNIDFTQQAWEKVCKNPYQSSKNGIDEPLPDFYVKIPTGGGKTLLACHIIDHINRIYLKKQTGIVLWIVPTTQIYRQTLDQLKDRDHPYRQVLNIASGDRTIILEKTDGWTKLDIEENQVVMLLMLPSANRKNNEVLKVFKDSGAFTDFFPPEDDQKAHNELIKKYPNLDYFGGENDFYGTIIKTSLGNTLRTLKPIVIIDEGHKAYSENARKTIKGFNPSIVVELSATPPKNGNILVNISGQELNREEMIKLDLHITNKTSMDWKDTMLSTVEKRNFLHQKAKEYESNTGEYIRPISLIQVERTGKDQIGSRFIHAEDVKEYLIKQCGIPEEEIAIKSSEKDDIEGIDLTSKECRINYIITKQALQEGWDCAFAYILTVLTNPSSQLGITQIVGRILRQPKAKKTKIKELDESYVFCFRQRANEVLDNVKRGFEEEGLGDLSSMVTSHQETESSESTTERTYRYRGNFRHFEGKIYLPKFVIQKNGSWHDLNYEIDILSGINWNEVKIDLLNEIKLTESRTEEQELMVNLDDNKDKVIKETGRIAKEGGFDIDISLIARQIMDVVPNPWVAYNLSERAINSFFNRYDNKKISDNLAFIIEELKKLINKEIDRLSEQVFRSLVINKKLFFFLLSDKGGYDLPTTIIVKSSSKRLTRNDNSPIEKSLFEFAEEEKFNEDEKAVALYLDEQEKLLWWYRNIARQNYFIQGWKKHKIYPDFVFAKTDDIKQNDYKMVHVVEIKGLHLKNEDTDYKKNVFDFCNALGKQKNWEELNMEFADKQVRFQVIFEDEWRKKINEIFAI